jgi:hypothetical protein
MGNAAEKRPQRGSFDFSEKGPAEADREPRRLEILLPASLKKPPLASDTHPNRTGT